jgi:hypothetical protein
MRFPPLAIFGGCRKIRRSTKFMPAISEILEAIDESQKFWSTAFEAANCIEDEYGELVALRDELAAKVQAQDQASAQRRITNATPQPLAPSFSSKVEVER